MILDPGSMAPMANLGMLSPDGVCYSFDHRANGYARGEGFGVVVIKPLTQALRDNDPIRAVIRATGSNQDGRTAGITQPSGDAQERLIRETYEQYGLDRRLTRYFEAHGTGTQIGDPIEAKAIATAFMDGRPSHEPLYVGAVKTNIGHLEGASGIAGLIKTILILERGLIPRNIWFERAHPSILESDWNIRVCLSTFIIYFCLLMCSSFQPRTLHGLPTLFGEHQSTPLDLEDPMFTLYSTMPFTISSFVDQLSTTALRNSHPKK